MIDQILFNEIPVKSIAESIQWYETILGFEAVWHSKEEKLAQLNLPSGQMLFLNETKDCTSANFIKNGLEHNVIGFHTGNMDVLYDHLKDNSVYVEKIVADKVGNKFLHFSDNDGNKFCVQSENEDKLSIS